MTKDFEDMLALLRKSVRGDDISLPENMNYGKIGTLALQQQIMPLIFSFIEEAYNRGEFQGKPQIVENMKTRIMMSVAAGIKRERFLSQVLDKMKERGIVCVLLKGALLADLYPEPELRLSGDIDLYVDEKDEKAAIEVLKELDFQVTPRKIGENDSECTHKIIKSLELHISLYEDHCATLWFDCIKYDMGKIQPYTTKGGYTYNALEVNEALMFNVLHLIKHFLSSGAGIRQILDVVLYMEKNFDLIDREKYAKTMKSLKFDYFMDCCMKIGVDFLGADKNRLVWINDCEIPDKDCEKVLNDIEESGLFGHNNNERRSFNKAYTEAVGRQKNEVIPHGGHGGIFSKIFLDYDRMKKSYGYLQNRKWLLPMGWLHRGIKVIFKKKTTEETLKIQEDHLKLMRDMKILQR